MSHIKGSKVVIGWKIVNTANENSNWFVFLTKFYSYFSEDYRETVGKNIPYRSMGYGTLEDFLDQSPDMCRISYNSTGGIMLHGVATEATAHVAALVARQRKGQKVQIHLCYSRVIH